MSLAFQHQVMQQNKMALTVHFFVEVSATYVWLSALGKKIKM
jgi:hypothetical protein